MIKRHFFFTMLIFLSFSADCFAGNIIKSDAERVATNWLYKVRLAQTDKAETIPVKSCLEIKEKEETLIYVFSMEPRGYVIVAGDDLSTPILGYSDKSNINTENLPPAFEAILTSFKEQILEARKQGLNEDEKSQSKWKKLLEPHEKFVLEPFIDAPGYTNEVLPLLHTTWNQVWPYNKMCPADLFGPGGHAVAGCVATALAQIMKFYNYPSTGFGSYGYYHSTYGYQFADFGSTTYDWSNMPDSLDGTSSETQQNVVAQLMYHCGVVVQMDYGTDGSGAQLGALPFSLFQNFNYSHPTLINQQMYPLDTLPDVLKQELDENRPVYYAAGSTVNGLRHALVCDGYQGDNFFHFNFGWGGMADGYFYLNSVTPALVYTNNYEAIINIQPDDGFNVRADTTWSGSLTINRRIGVRSNATLTIEPGTTLNFGRYGGLSVYGNIQAIGTTGSPIEFTTQDTIVGWNGIELNNALTTASNQDSSKFVHCNIKYAKASYTSTTSMCGVYYWVTCALRITNYSKLLIDLCILFKNEGANRSGGIDLYHSSSRISNSLITRNKSFFCPAILISAATWDISYPVIENNIISYNVGGYAGAIVCESSASPIIKNNKIIFNSAFSGYGLTIYYDASATVVNNLISENSCIGEYYPGSQQSVIECENTVSSFNSNTIVNNHGCGIFSRGINTLTLNNNIIWGNDGSTIGIQQGYGYAILNVAFCDIQGGQDGFDIDDPGPSIITYENNISADPGFIGVDNFQLSDLSSCVNQGTPDLYGKIIPNEDISGNPRIFGGRIDMGAYENQDMVAPDDLFLTPSKIDFISNVLEIDSVLVRVIYINNGGIDSLGSLSLPFGRMMSDDSLCIKITIESPIVGEFQDTLIIYSTVGPKQIPISAWVGTVACGEVSGIWNTPLVKVKCDIIIPNGATLQINPGTKVEFLGHNKIDVKGRLLALGDSNEMITFTPSNPVSGWKGIRFENTSSTNDTSVIQCCILEKGINRGINLERDGGALFVSGFPKLILSDCLIQNNNAAGYSGGGVMLTNGANILIRNCRIMNNIATDGGAIYIKASNPKIICNHITGNQAFDGGAINIFFGSSPLITNNLIVNNRGQTGGAFRIWAESDPMLFNNTIVNNTAYYGGGLQIAYNSHPSLINNIIYGNFVLYPPTNTFKNYDQIYLSTNADPDFYNNNIEGGHDSIVVEGGYTLQGVFQDNIDVNPNFMQYKSHEYYIYSSSPCFDVGNVAIGAIDLGSSFDLAGNPRIFGGRIDIGAYEYNPMAITMPIVITTPVSGIGLNSATLGGNVISDCGATVITRGVCWNTSSDPTIADSLTINGSGIGSFSNTIINFSPNTTYYVRAYATNSVGTSYGNQIIFSTFSSCGSFTVYHVAGSVAPVTKTVIYNTVVYIPGEPLKCWITSNLGADHLANMIDDPTEASAGWYWQFNHKQGYKHDWMNRTPNTTWITFINEDINWEAAKDPCVLELGSNWRIPTSTEWTNLYASGNWTDWNGPWNSGLKLYAAGYLDPNYGWLFGRGVSGYFWSSTQSNSNIGLALKFNSGICLMDNVGKINGFTLRCIRDDSAPPGWQFNGTFTYNNSTSTPLDNMKIVLLRNTLRLDSVLTNSLGNFQFNQVQDGTYVLKPYTNKPWGGVNSTDALNVERHFVGIEQLTVPVRWLAGDVNNSNNINATDAVKMKRRFVGLESSFPRGNWVFAKPTGGDTVIVSGGNAVQDFQGLCVGDVNGSNVPAQGKWITQSVELANDGIIEVSPGQVFELPVRIGQKVQISAISMVLGYPREYIALLSVFISQGDVIYTAQNGQIRIAWSQIEPLNLNSGDDLLILQFRLSDNAPLGIPIMLNIGSESELADGWGNPISNSLISTPSVLPVKQTGVNETNNLITKVMLYPNPATHSVWLEFELLIDADIVVEWYNVVGELIKTIRYNGQSKGTYRRELDVSGFPYGVYTLKTQINGQTSAFVYHKLVISK